MAQELERPAERSEGAIGNDRLDSWKEIAAHLKRDVTTVRRWEKREGLPVHRHLHERRDSVYAFVAEIDDWWKGRRTRLTQDAPAQGTADAHEAPSVAPARRARLAWMLAGVFFLTSVGLAVTLAIVYQRTPVSEQPQQRFSVFPPDEASFGTTSLSPDGRQLAFTGIAADGSTRLWLGPLDARQAKPLADTEDASLPFWRPDSRALGFFAAGKVWTVDVSGEHLRAIAPAPAGRGATWNADGVIIFAPTRDGALYSVAAEGGESTPVTVVDRSTERGHLWPEFLPNGKHFVYLADSAEPDQHFLFAGALFSAERWRLFRLASNAVYSRAGYLLFEQERKLMAQPFDAARLTAIGEPVHLADHVVQQWNLDHKTDVSVSNNGILMYRSLGGFDTQLVWRDRDEQQSALVTARAGYSEPTLSPDKKRIAVGIFDSRPSQRFGFGTSKITADIWMVDATSGALSQFTSNPASDFEPVWSPDGTRIAFSSNRSGTLDLYQKNANGSGAEELVYSSPVPKHAETWSPDGRFLVFLTFESKTRYDIWLLPITGDRTPVPLVRTAGSESQTQISPDGRWFSYTSNESGKSEVYVQSFPTPAERWQISPKGGGDARWNADGKELFYIAEDRRLMAVPVTTGGTFTHGTPVPLFDTGMRPDWGTSRNHYDVTRDGRRFVFMVPVADDRSSPFTIVLNWSAALRKE